MSYFVYFVTTYSLAWLIVHSKILEPLVDWVAERSETFNILSQCIICTGFWCSLFLLFLLRHEPVEYMLMAPIMSITINATIATYLGDYE